ncbi:Ig-like domain-containing protein, partial [Acinetobacter indicus]|uniref:Ig-like domain-containing protein n=1 Tax=Acinetobacter indicus TaxID=756892 RepID=UPI001315A4A7
GDNTPVVAGTATANSQVNVYANGVLVGQTTADNKGKWSLELPKQADGDVTIEAAEANAAGEGPKSAEIVITIDTKAPDAPTGIEIETTTTTDDEDNEIVDQTVTGKASPEEAGSTVVVKDKDGTVIAEGKVDAEGNFAVEIPTDRLIPEGGKVDVIVVDKAENSSKPTEVVRGDETGPVLETAEVNGEGQIILSFNEALDANDPAKLDSFTVTVGKDDNQATVKVLDIDVIGNQVVLTTEPPIYAGQEYKVDYKDKDLTDANAIQDRSGNDAADFSTADLADGKVSNGSTQNPNPDLPTNQPTITGLYDNRVLNEESEIKADEGEPLITGDNTPVVAGTATANSQVNVYANGVLVGQTTADNQGKWSLELPKQADGDVTIEAAEANAAGEGPNKSAEIVITIDTKAPDAPTGIEIETTTTTDDEDNEIVDQTVTGKASPEEAGSTVVVKDKDGTVIAEGKVDAEGNFAVEIPTDRLIPEGGKVDVIVVDKAENSSKPTEVVRGDETGPVLETAEVNGEGQIILSFNEALDANDPAKLDSFTVTVGKDDNQATVKVLDIDVIGNQVVLTTEPPIYAGQEYKVDYKDKDLTDANAIQDRSGNDAADFSTADLADGKVSNGSTQNPNPDLPTNQPTITGLYDNRVLNEESEIKADEGEPLITGDNTPVVAGTATANSQVNVYANGVLVGQTTADNKGKWSLELPKQADGDVTIEAAEANAAGEG